MNSIYFHHYRVSPFAEKVRAMFGYKGLAWYSVTQPMIMPKPDLTALTGGYRRIPVMQIGNQVICDTALMTDVLDCISPNNRLIPPEQEGLARSLAQWADGQLFPVAMAHNFSPAGAQHVFQGQAPEALAAFAADRQAMRGGAARMHPHDASGIYKQYLRRIASLLKGQDFVLGSAPSVADFSIYHPLWFTRNIVPPVANILDSTPEVIAWIDRMAAFGTGTVAQSSVEDSLAACATVIDPVTLFGPNTLFVDEHGIALGERVSIAAESFGVEATEGELVAATASRYTLRRVDARAGEVFVSFPRVGFTLRRAA